MKSKDKIATVLVIAGSDPCGGAGMQADLKTLTLLGVYGAAAVTCITVQNSRGVCRIEPLSSDLVNQQVEAVLADHRVSHIKIGMVGSPEIAGELGSLLKGFPGEVIYDPVMAAGTGHRLLQEGTVETICRKLLPVTTVLTPNIPELRALSGINPLDKTGRQQAVRTLFAKNPRLNCILVKGGHGQVENGKLTDTCCLRKEERRMQHRQIETVNLHGTGCTLASAFTAFHMQTGDYMKSFTRSVEFLQELIRISAPHETVRSDGQGPLLHPLMVNPVP